MYRSKLYRSQVEEISKKTLDLCSISDAIEILKNISHVKFDETLELSMKLSIDMKRTDQIPRGSVVLPNGTGKKQTILVVVPNDKLSSIRDSIEVDYVGSEEIIDKIKKGWVDFDIFITTPEIMPKIRTLGKLLGPKGLMPSIKSGTLTEDVVTSVNDIKKGTVEIKLDKCGNVHFAAGKIFFDNEKLIENCEYIIKEVIRLKPKKVKGDYIRSCYISTTMSPSIMIKLNKVVRN